MFDISTIKQFIKNEIVLVIAFILAVASSIIIHPDSKYISYIDFRTLAILLSLMLTMAGFQSKGVFRQIGQALVCKANTIRGVCLVLVFLSFFSSMFITNDVALLTFVPFSIVTLSIAKRKDLMIRVIVFETIAANLGSMTTPIGNPQNLYLYSKANMSMGNFLKLMMPYAIVSALLLIVFVLLQIKGTVLSVSESEVNKRSRKDKLLVAMYVGTFLIALLVVARYVNYVIGLVITLLLVLIFNRKILLKADYSLLLTFVFLFIFIGNMKRIPAVCELLMGLVTQHEVVVSVILSQVLSNVPTAILCSGFTDNIKGLIVGTNFGGLGTLIASMASLISFKQYGFIEGADKKKYIFSFTIYNLIFLAVLMGLYFILKNF